MRLASSLAAGLLGAAAGWLAWGTPGLLLAALAALAWLPAPWLPLAVLPLALLPLPGLATPGSAVAVGLLGLAATLPLLRRDSLPPVPAAVAVFVLGTLLVAANRARLGVFLSSELEVAPFLLGGIALASLGVGASLVGLGGSSQSGGSGGSGEGPSSKP